MRRAILFVCVCAFAGSAHANLIPTLGDILDREDLSGVYSTGQYYVEALPGFDVLSMTIVLEDAGYAELNRFGIFDYGDRLERLDVFTGGEAAGTEVVVTFDIANGQAWIDPMEKYDIGPVFGFYLDSSGQGWSDFFFSDTRLSLGVNKQVDHALLFDTKGINGVDSDIIVAFDDLRANWLKFDGDYSDMVVGITNAKVKFGVSVPEPMTIGVLGMGIGMFLLRKRP